MVMASFYAGLSFLLYENTEDIKIKWFLMWIEIFPFVLAFWFLINSILDIVHKYVLLFW